MDPLLKDESQPYPYLQPNPYGVITEGVQIQSISIKKVEPPPPPPPPQPIIMVQQPTVMMVHQPFANFQISAGKSSCPSCGFSQTVTNRVIGNKVILWAVILLLFTWCLCWIPFVMTDCYDQEIICARCGFVLIRIPS